MHINIEASTLLLPYCCDFDVHFLNSLSLSILQAKKQASIRWVMTKALIHVPKEYLIDPFKESKKV